MGKEGVMGAADDITGRPQQEGASLESEARYYALFQNALEGIFRSTPEGHFTEVNPALVRMLGYASAEEVLALKLPDDLYVDPAQRTHLRANYETAGAVEGEELQWKKKNGEQIVVSLYARVIRDLHGRVVGYEGLVLDITARKRAGLAGTAVPICRPFAEIDTKTSGGSDGYNALQVTLARRFSTGLTLNSQYTFSRSFGNTSGSNEARTAAQPFEGSNGSSKDVNNYKADRGYNNFDVRQTLNVSAIYSLPFGKGKAWDAGRFGNALLGNWEIGTIWNARSGIPIDVTVTRPEVVIQCTDPSKGCAPGEVRPLPGTINAATPLPAGFTAVVNAPGGGNSRQTRRPDLLPGV
ncbi:MAG: PAS domain S-box protein, partial [Deltaproteobacteria bacterium]|nr:PAS domain S-box protein [Deltaproteobacteria bacterium]